MTNTAAAIRAAKEVQGDTLSPDNYRLANEWFFRAKREYKLKNFDTAKKYADKARRFAEQAEFDAIRAGTARGEHQIADPYSNIPNDPMAGATNEPPPTPVPTPEASAPPQNQGVWAEQIEQQEAQKRADERAAQQQRMMYGNQMPAAPQIQEKVVMPGAPQPPSAGMGESVPTVSMPR